jgi:hypothetical protein
MSDEPYISQILREYFQDQRISNAKSRIGDVRQSQENLQNEVHRLQLVVEALWELLRKHNGLTDQDLIKVMNQIDAVDGRLDGKSSRTEVTNCSGCGKVLEKGVPKCIYCGLLHKVSPFDHR